eukprot:CAMPEP_0204007896 /NCGR_PEP_ID=MMETSP0360-20130528/20790_1 /ASSEMBLY_ACC=CAM_ASM_000342 /TAXON_ID=268821 /ORGANISM="Scrippsiella Hangoei, Strain SHTV-5" /LENGTH=77 /DNA_ID=CAMNT_0050950137 /DNA_START=14 /DNA_END=243 /DNA_ORIENTATION=+
MTPQPASIDMVAAWMASVTLPIWLTFSSNALHAFSSMAFCTLVGVGDEEVVAHDLGLPADGALEHRVGLPIVLVEGV